MLAVLEVPTPSQFTAALPDAESSDSRIFALWIHGRSQHTQRAYRRAIAQLATFRGGKSLRTLTLGDLQDFANSLGGKASSQAQTLAAIKSLLSFACKIGALPLNVGAALRVPKGRDGLADRILSEADVAKMLALSNGRDHALVRIMYAAGFRVSEVVSLRWSDVAEASDGGAFVTVLGKGRKTRTVRLSVDTAAVLAGIRGDAAPAAPIFSGRRAGTTLSPAQAWRIVRSVADRASIAKHVSPHFLRHSHGSHALERGASIVLVRDTLGHSSVAVTDRYLHARPGESSSRFLAV